MRLPLFLFCFLLLAAGCRVAAPEAPSAAAQLPAAFPATHPSADSLGAGGQPWNRFYQDSALTALIDTALRNNLDLRVAVQRVELARADYVERRGALFPTVSLGGTAGLDRYGRYTLNGVGNYDTNLSQNIASNQVIPGPLTPDFFGGLRSNWEIDIWGKLRSRRRAAYLRVLASEEGRRLVQTNLVAEIARNYYELLTLDNQLAVVQRNARLQQEALRLMRIQKQAGRATELAVQQFAAQTLRTESLAYEARQGIVETETRLNQLLGRYPAPIKRGTTLPEAGLVDKLGVGIPAAALRHRPDVRQAEAELAAGQADIAAAQAAFLPSLTLTPYLGLNAFRADLLFNPNSVVFGVLGGLTGPLINRAAFRADLRRAAAGRNETYYRYQQALQTGYRDVVIGLRGLENYRSIVDLRAREAAQLRSAIATSNELYLAGYASYLEVVTAQRSSLDAELNLAEARRDQLLQGILLYQALGGGWEQ
jgi:NodT family efflux transporter outer membrane factor (OMF) lipoprotein